MMGKIFFWGLLAVLVVSLSIGVVGLVGEFSKFQDPNDKTDDVVAEAEAPAPEAEPQLTPEAPAEPDPSEEPATATEAQATPEPATETVPESVTESPAETAAESPAEPETETQADPETDTASESGLPVPRRKPDPTEPTASAPSTETPEPAQAEPAQTEPAQAETAQTEPAVTERPQLAAAGFQLGAPIACTPNEDCWVSTYFDHDTGPGRKDHACGLISYDTHGGIDFAIANLAVMQRGVSVIASAPGRVVGTRDEMADINMDDADPAGIKGRDCGNGVRIDHGDGWATQYCHMKRGSIVVRSGQEVAIGDVLGQVGLSGRTQHPHVHISVLKDGKKLDPYTGAEAGTTACGDTSGTLWNAETARAFSYRTGLIRDAFFALGVPDIKDVKAGTAARRSGSTDSPELVLWAQTMGTLRDHTISMTIKAPGGQTVSENVYDKPKVYAAVGIRGRRPQSGWPAGVYTGVIEVRNGQGQITDSQQVAIELN